MLKLNKTIYKDSSKYTAKHLVKPSAAFNIWKVKALKMLENISIGSNKPLNKRRN